MPTFSQPPLFALLADPATSAATAPLRAPARETDPAGASPSPQAAAENNRAAASPRRRQACAVVCAASLRDAVLRLAQRRGLTPSELAEAALALLSPAVAAVVADPGPPENSEREYREVTLASGRRRRIGRLPGLRLRLSGEPTPAAVRQALSLALALDDLQAYRLLPAAEQQQTAAQIARLETHNRELRAALDRVTFKTLPTRTLTPKQAAHILGFANEWGCDEARVKQRFRELAPIFHPDAGLLACRERMEQLIQAKSLLLRHLTSR